MTLPLSNMLLKDIIISRVRVKILTLFLLNPNQPFYVRQIVRNISEEINAVRRELIHLEKIGLLKKEYRSNRLYYSIRKDYLLYFDLLGLINKVDGLGGEILKNRRKLGRLKFVLLSGKYARRIERKSTEIDLLVVGDIVVAELAKIIKEQEEKQDREINFTVMKEEEFEYRKKRNDPFITQILGGSRIMVYGDEEELVK